MNWKRLLAYITGSVDQKLLRGFGIAFGTGESQLGISADCRRAQQSRTRRQPPDRGQSSETARYGTSTRTGKDDELARVYPIAHRGSGFCGLLHGRIVD